MARTGRPLAMPPAERKAAIFAAAEHLFSERGYEKVTMSDIAAAAGMSKRTLYNLFDEKGALLQSLIDSSYIWPDDAFERQEADSVDQLRTRLRVIANHVLSDRHINLCRLAIAERIGMSGLAEAFVEMGIGKSRESLIQTIAAIDRERFVLDLPPATLAAMVFGGTCGANLMTALLTGEKPDMTEVYATIDQIVAKSFKPLVAVQA